MALAGPETSQEFRPPRTDALVDQPGESRTRARLRHNHPTADIERAGKGIGCCRVPTTASSRCSRSSAKLHGLGQPPAAPVLATYPVAEKDFLGRHRSVPCRATLTTLPQIGGATPTRHVQPTVSSHHCRMVRQSLWQTARPASCAIRSALTATIVAAGVVACDLRPRWLRHRLDLLDRVRRPLRIIEALGRL